MMMYYPTWPRAQIFMKEVQQKHIAGQQTTVPFSIISSIVTALVDTFGTFNGKQCQGLKQTLGSMQQTGSAGCVNLGDFYKKGLKADSNWLFVESPDYLRQIGTLDESNPKDPRLLVANYINSPTNCLQPSGYYLVCCHNECDEILGQLETHIGTPTATPTEIIAALRRNSNLGTSSLRTGGLPPALQRRLEDVAQYHGGRVPIHGRLFAQWLHHVFPNECPYPHLSGTTKPQYVEDFEKETHKSSTFTDQEMTSFVQNASQTGALSMAKKSLHADAGSCAPWQSDEELFAPVPLSLPLHELENDPHVWNLAGAIAALAAISTLVITLMRTCSSVGKLRYQPKMLQI